MRIDPHARDPDDGDQDPDRTPSNDDLRNDDDENTPELIEHERAFVPPKDQTHLAPSHLHQLLRDGHGSFAKDELAVLMGVRTTLAKFAKNKKDSAIGQAEVGKEMPEKDGVLTEILATDFLAEILSRCASVVSYGTRLAEKLSKGAAYASKGRRIETGSDLFQEAVYRWISGRWTYTKAQFDADIDTGNPSLYVRYRLFGHSTLGRLRSLLHGDGKSSETKDASEAEFFNDQQSESTSDGDIVQEQLSSARVFELLYTDQVRQRMHELVAITAERNGFGKYSLAAPQVFRLLCDEPRLDVVSIAKTCEVSVGFVYKMDQTGIDHKKRQAPYVLEKIREYASDTQVYQDMLTLCPSSYRERFMHSSLEALANAMTEELKSLGLYSSDGAGDEGRVD